MADEGTNSANGLAANHPHLRIRFQFDDDGPAVDFLDQRTFGGMAFAPGRRDLPAVIEHIARDPLDPEFSMDEAVAAIRRKKTEIKRALLDQTVVSGIGNIYADEALWQAKVHYARPTSTMTRPVAQGRADRRHRGHDAGPRRRRHLLRRVVRQRERRVRLLRPVAERVRPGEPALPAVRHPDPPRRLHESVVLLLPEVSTPAPTGALTVLPHRRVGACASPMNFPMLRPSPPPRRWPGRSTTLCGS